MSDVNRPEWWGMNEDELEEYVEARRREYRLSPEEAQHLHSQLSMKLSHWAKRLRPRSPSEEEREVAIMRDITEVATRIGSGLTARTFSRIERKGAAAPDVFVRKMMKRSRKRRGKKPFASLARDTQFSLDDYRWAAGYLQVGWASWLIPSGENKPRESVWWYCNEIERLLESAKSQSADREPEFAARNAFEAGRLLTELEMRLAHNSFFEKQTAIAEAQRNAPRARRRQSDEVRRERVRDYLLLGDKPLTAAENAARDLEVSVSTIRRAFPDGLLPEGPEDF